MMGLAKTGGIASNGSGDYVIAVSTSKDNFIPYQNESLFIKTEELDNGAITPLFLAVIEATEEAILNSLFAAKTMMGRENHKRESIPIDEVIEIMKKYNGISTNN
jgi:D-aminopeptidase